MKEMEPDTLGIIPRALQELLDYSKKTDGLVQLRASYVGRPRALNTAARWRPTMRR